MNEKNKNEKTFGDLFSNINNKEESSISFNNIVEKATDPIEESTPVTMETLFNQSKEINNEQDKEFNLNSLNELSESSSNIFNPVLEESNNNNENIFGVPEEDKQEEITLQEEPNNNNENIFGIPEEDKQEEIALQEEPNNNNENIFGIPEEDKQEEIALQEEPNNNNENIFGIPEEDKQEEIASQEEPNNNNENIFGIPEEDKQEEIALQEEPNNNNENIFGIPEKELQEEIASQEEPNNNNENIFGIPEEDKQEEIALQEEPNNNNENIFGVPEEDKQDKLDDEPPRIEEIPKKNTIDFENVKKEEPVQQINSYPAIDFSQNENNNNQEISSEQSTNSKTEKETIDANPFFDEESNEKEKAISPFFVEEDPQKENDNPFFDNTINLVENKQHNIAPTSTSGKIDTSSAKKFDVKIVKKKEPLLKFIIGVLSYAIFIWLLLIGITLLVYIADIKIRAAKGDYSPPKYNAYVVLTGSMLPEIQVYDVVVTKKTEAKELKEGDVITFASSDTRFLNTIITHRIIKKNYDAKTKSYTFQTKGDNNNVADSALVQPNNIYGKVILKVPKLGYLQHFLAKDGGYILVVIVPCLIVISYDIVKLIKGLKRRKYKNIKVQK